METNHTPGPWNVTKALDNEFSMRRIYSIITRGMVLAHVNEAYDVEGGNARLIAAAPELLAALEKAFLEMGRMGANHDLEHPCRLAWCLAREAISKATNS